MDIRVQRIVFVSTRENAFFKLNNNNKTYTYSYTMQTLIWHSQKLMLLKYSTHDFKLPQKTLEMDFSLSSQESTITEMKVVKKRHLQNLIFLKWHTLELMHSKFCQPVYTTTHSLKQTKEQTYTHRGARTHARTQNTNYTCLHKNRCMENKETVFEMETESLF